MNPTVNYYNKRVTKYYLNNYKGAASDFFKATEIELDFQESYYNKGIKKHQHGRHRASLTGINMAVKNVSNHAEAFKSRGFANYMYGDKCGACLDWIKAVKLKDKEVYALIETYFS